MTKNASKFIAAIGEVNAGLENIRDRINDLKAERDQVERARKAPEEIASAVKKYLDERAADALQSCNFSRFSGTGERDDWPNFDGVMAHYPIGMLVVLGLRDTIEPAILAQATAAAGKNTLTKADRVNRLAKIDAKLDALEREEESFIREAEAAGLTIPRRVDARPEIYLQGDDNANS